MTLQLPWNEAALRLILAFFTTAILGFNREERGRPAGLRTTVLVGMAAACAMVLANLLLDTAGRPDTSFVTIDVMRLPLGILTGVGFIGAGAILHRGNFTQGVTTASTLWFATVMGFCFGGGEFGLGTTMLGVGIATLWGFKWVEDRLISHSEATLTVILTDDASTAVEDVLAHLLTAGFQAALLGYHTSREGCELTLQVHRRNTRHQVAPPESIRHLGSLPQVRDLRWKPVP